MKPNFIFVLTLIGALHAQAQSSNTSVNASASPTAPTAPPEVLNETHATTSAEPISTSQSQKVERIEVTGSHIKRIDTEGAAPVETITRKDLDKSGYNSVSDVLRDMTASSFGGTREESGSNAAGSATVDLRGLGSSNTLVLLNGQRLPTDAVTGAVDLNLIPMAAVERIEVLKDGASAIYGSDALGGVVNIITRKDFTGNEITLAQTTPEQAGGKKQEISLVNGFNKGRLNMVNVVQYRDNKSVFNRDREWSNNGTSTTGSPGSYRNAGGQWHADPNCPAGMVQHDPVNGDVCTFRHTDYSTALPAIQQLSLMSESNVEVSSKVRLKARVGGTDRKTVWNFAPSPGTFKISGSKADTSGPGGTPLPGAAPGQPLSVKYRLVELGNRDHVIDTKGYNLLLGTAVDVGNEWEVEITGAHNMIDNRDKGVNGYALTSDVERQIENGNFRPFEAPGQRGDLNMIRYQPEENTTSQLSSAEIKASGSLAELSSGPLGLAVGSNFAFQKYEDKYDEHSINGEVFGNAGSSGGGQRDTQAVYTELSVPIVKTLELQLAGRYDHYSDFGSSVNPKAALLYKPDPSVLLRTSVGTGFKAPLMQELYAATSDGYQTFVDPKACAAELAADPSNAPSCTPQQYHVVSGGNKDLREEKSLSVNGGVVFEPSRDFNISLDGFYTKLKNVVGIDYQDLMTAEERGLDLTSRGVVITRDSNGYIDTITAPLQNLAAQEVSGIDIATSTRIVRRVKLSMEHSQMLYFKEEGFPGVGMTNKLGRNGRPPWRNQVGLTYNPGERHDITVSGLTTAANDKSVREKGQLPVYTTYDLLYSYKSESLGTFALGVKNLAGTVPPLDDSDPNNELNTSLYDQIGRSVYTSYKATF